MSSLCSGIFSFAHLEGLQRSEVASTLIIEMSAQARALVFGAEPGTFHPVLQCVLSSAHLLGLQSTI